MSCRTWSLVLSLLIAGSGVDAREIVTSAPAAQLRVSTVVSLDGDARLLAIDPTVQRDPLQRRRGDPVSARSVRRDWADGYEEPYAAWCLQASPKMAERYDESLFGMVRRDRNHPSVIIWGLLNETHDGPVFRHAAAALPKLRELDDSRMVLLNSGRWDLQLPRHLAGRSILHRVG